MRWTAEHAKCICGLVSNLAKHSAQVAVCFVSFVLIVQEASGAEMTLRFEAEIDRVSGIPFDSGIEFAEGDVVSGRFTFEPVTGDGSMTFEESQPHSFLFDVNGIGIFTSNIEFESVNNTTLDDPPPPTDVDWLVLGAGGLLPVPPANLPNVDATASSFRMTLFGPADTFSQAGIPSGVDTWNDFTLRRQLNVSFRSGSGDVVGFQATVRPFVAIPEPLLSQSVVAGFLSFSILFKARIRSVFIKRCEHAKSEDFVT